MADRSLYRSDTARLCTNQQIDMISAKTVVGWCSVLLSNAKKFFRVFNRLQTNSVRHKFLHASLARIWQLPTTVTLAKRESLAMEGIHEEDCNAGTHCSRSGVCRSG
jgi:hypothetical protein